MPSQPRPSRSNQAYSALRERIASGELKPGAVVSEAALARDLGISRTPIGEALRRLSHDGLVEQVPRYGTIVRDISPSELEELFEIREALESMAARKAADRISAATVDELSSLCDRIEAEIESAERDGRRRLEGEHLRRFLAADMAFHMLIIESAGNRRLGALLENTRSISSMFNANRGEHSIERLRNANQAHRRIVEAFAQRDGERAAALVVDHIRKSCEQSVKERETPPPVSLGTLNLPASVRERLLGST